MEQATKTLAEALQDFEIDCTYVPYTGTTIKGATLSYSIVLKYRGREILTTPYQMGIGHIPGWMHKMAHTVFEVAQTLALLKKGSGSLKNRHGQLAYTVGAPIRPTVADVMYSLINDADVLQYPGLEAWAREVGFDPDSRKAEATYRACLDIALKLKNGIGDDTFEGLVKVFIDY